MLLEFCQIIITEKVCPSFRPGSGSGMTARPESSVFSTRSVFWMPVADPVISGDQVRHDEKHIIFSSPLSKILTWRGSERVTESDMYLTSSTLPDRELGRGVHNFTLFNLNYIPSTRFEKKDRGGEAKPAGKLSLTPFEEKLGVKVIRTKDEKRYELAKDFHTVDQIVYDIYDRFRLRTFEALYFDFGSVVVDDRYPEEDEIRQVIIEAMKEAGIEGTRLSEENRKESDMYFNRFLPPGKKKRIFENIEGDIDPIPTFRMDRSGIRASALERDRTAFLSEDYESEAGETNNFVLDFISELRRRPEDKQQLSLFKPDDFVESKDEIIRPFVKGDTRPTYLVNTSKLKSPQYIVLVSHSPEKEFVFQLIDSSDYIDSWIKSPDKNFYSIDFRQMLTCFVNIYCVRIRRESEQVYLTH